MFPHYYKLVEPTPMPHQENRVADSPVVDDVVAAVESLGKSDESITLGRISDGHQFPAGRYESGGNHFQGIQRYGKYLLISGADPGLDGNGGLAHLFVADIDRGEIISTLPLGDKLWHGGGVGIVGDFLGVPIENLAKKAPRSSVVFLDLADVAKIVRLEPTIDRDKASHAVALCRAHGRLLCCVFDDKTLDFYSGIGDTPYRGFVPSTSLDEYTYRTQSGHEARLRFPKYQSISLIRQKDDEIFLLGTYNKAKAAPIQPGQDVIDILRVHFDPSGQVRKVSARPNVRVKGPLRRRRKFTTNLDAAGGVWIDPQTRKPALYMTSHWRDPANGAITYTEIA